MTPQAPAPLLSSRHFLILTLAYVIFIIFGSLVPFQYRPLSWEEAFAALRASADGRLIESRSDFVANVLLFVPLAFVALAAGAVDRAGYVGWLLSGPVWLGCMVLSVAVEFTQAFFPPRDPSVRDVFANGLGSVAGIFVWLIGGRRIVDSCRRISASRHVAELAESLLPAYVALMVLLHVLPLDLTLKPAAIYHKYRDGRIRLVPFATPFADTFERIEVYLWVFVFFAPVGLLVAKLPHGSWKQARQWPWLLGLGMALSALIEFMQIFVMSRVTDVTDVFLGGLAVLLGWCIGLALDQWRHVSFRYLLLLGWLGMVVFVQWRPFDFSTTMRLPGSWTPFFDYHEQNYFNSLDQLVRKTVLFLPGGMILTWIMADSWRAGLGWAVMLIAFAIAAGTEIGQLFLPTRHFSVTDIVIGTAGAWLGMVIVLRQAGFQAERASLPSAVLPGS